jgi:hypothetical protein
MLVYIIESDRDVIMKDIQINEIPVHLKERFDEENDSNNKLERERERKDECGTVYVVS